MTETPPERLVLETPRLLARTLGAGDEARLQAALAAASPRPVAPDAAAGELAACAAQPGRRIAVLSLREGGDVGVIGWWTGNPEPGQALLGTLALAPEHRRQGLAREALAALEEWLAESGIHGLRTAFPRRRLELHPVARALGFREMSIAEHTRLGMAGAGTSLWEKPLGAG